MMLILTNGTIFAHILFAVLFGARENAKIFHWKQVISTTYALFHFVSIFPGGYIVANYHHRVTLRTLLLFARRVAFLPAAPLLVTLFAELIFALSRLAPIKNRLVVFVFVRINELHAVRAVAVFENLVEHPKLVRLEHGANFVAKRTRKSILTLSLRHVVPKVILVIRCNVIFIV